MTDSIDASAHQASTTTDTSESHVAAYDGTNHAAPFDLFAFPGRSISRAPPSKPSWLRRGRRSGPVDLNRAGLLSCRVPSIIDAREYDWGIHRIYFNAVRFSGDKQRVLLHIQEELMHRGSLQSFTRMLTVQRLARTAPTSGIQPTGAADPGSLPVTVEAVWPRLPIDGRTAGDIKRAFGIPPPSKAVWANRQCAVALHTNNVTPAAPTIRGAITSPSSVHFSSEGRKHYHGVCSHADLYVLAHVPEVQNGRCEPHGLVIKLDVRATKSGILSRSREFSDLATHAVTCGQYGPMGDVHGILRELLERPDLIPSFHP